MRSGNNLLENTDPGPEKDELQNKLDNTKQRWNNIKDKVSSHKEKVNAAIPEAAKYSTAADGLEPWLNEAEEKLSSLEPISADEIAIKERQEFINSMKDEIEKHRPERVAVEDKCESVVDLTEDDQELVQSQAKDLIDRYDKLCADCLEKEKETSEIQDALASYADALSPVQGVLDKAEDLVGDGAPISGDLEKNKEELDNIKVSILCYVYVFWMSFGHYVRSIVLSVCMFVWIYS